MLYIILQGSLKQLNFDEDFNFLQARSSSKFEISLINVPPQHELNC